MSPSLIRVLRILEMLEPAVPARLMGTCVMILCTLRGSSMLYLREGSATCQWSCHSIGLPNYKVAFLTMWPWVAICSHTPVSASEGWEDSAVSLTAEMAQWLRLLSQKTQVQFPAPRSGSTGCCSSISWNLIPPAFSGTTPTHIPPHNKSFQKLLKN